MSNNQIAYLEKRRKLVGLTRNIITNSLNLTMEAEDIPQDAILFGEGLNFDSIDALQLVTVLENEFQIKIPQNDPIVLRSVNTIVDFLIKTL